ncbi:MAG: hypothetical protein HY853_01750, partial [Burkholderiales bacterium]|nr:hypothetical protein [Burkholderiales bacterium]
MSMLKIHSWGSMKPRGQLNTVFDLIGAQETTGNTQLAKVVIYCAIQQSPGSLTSIKVCICITKSLLACGRLGMVSGSVQHHVHDAILIPVYRRQSAAAHAGERRGQFGRVVV